MGLWTHLWFREAGGTRHRHFNRRKAGRILSHGGTAAVQAVACTEMHSHAVHSNNVNAEYADVFIGELRDAQWRIDMKRVATHELEPDLEGPEVDVSCHLVKWWHMCTD